MDLSVVVVSWNTRDLLAECLASLFHHPPAAAWEVWVVDNASSDGSAAMVRDRFPAAHLIENQANLGFAAANNQGFRQSAGRYVLLLNSDARVRLGALDAMLKFLDGHPEVGAAGPKLVNPDGSFQASYASFPTLLSELGSITGLDRWWLGPNAPSPRPVAGEAPHAVDWVAGAALIVRRAAVDEVGPLDEGYFLYSEETDWCLRLWRAGWPVWYLPQVEVIHRAGASSRQQSTRSYSLLYQSKLRFFSRHYGGAAALALRLAYLASALARLSLWKTLLLFPGRAARQPGWRARAEQERALLQTCLAPQT